MKEFSAAFAVAEMAGIIGEFHMEMGRAIERAGKLVEREAKKEIGQYQDGSPPFVSWPELADYTKDDRTRLGFTENDPGLRTGQMGADIDTKIFNHGDQHEANIGSDDDELLWFELGTVTQPPRSVLGLAAVRNEEKIREILGESAVLAMTGAAGITQVGKGVAGGEFDITE
jgi:hypothetical protein